MMIEGNVVPIVGYGFIVIGVKDEGSNGRRDKITGVTPSWGARCVLLQCCNDEVNHYRYIVHKQMTTFHVVKSPYRLKPWAAYTVNS